MTAFISKPTRVHAIQFTQDNFREVAEFVGERPARDNPNYMLEGFTMAMTYVNWEDPEIVAEVWDKLHSTHVGVKYGQWIIKGTQGEFYPCDDEVFRQKYEVDDFNTRQQKIQKARDAIRDALGPLPAESYVDDTIRRLQDLDLLPRIDR